MRNLQEYANRCMKQLDDIGVKYGNVLAFEINTRAKHRWGQCKRVSSILNCFTININHILLDEKNNEQALIDTLMHELLHTCKGCFNHKNEWKRLAEKVNGIYNYNIKRTASEVDYGIEIETENITEPKYKIQCTNCGKVYTRQRKSKVVAHPENYRCYDCGGEVILI